MKFFIDTANVDEIRKANDMGIIAGVTTNPSLIAKEGRDYAETLAEIATIVDGPISGEVKATTVDAETMVAEGEAIYALDPKHMVVKIPMTAEGLKAIKALSAKGIPTNCTLVFSANQALLAARAGATYVSPFLGRLDDIGQPGIELIETIHDMFLNYPDIDTQIIAASVRNPIHERRPRKREIDEPGAKYCVRNTVPALNDRKHLVHSEIENQYGNPADKDADHKRNAKTQNPCGPECRSQKERGHKYELSQQTEQKKLKEEIHKPPPFVAKPEYRAEKQHDRTQPRNDSTHDNLHNGAPQRDAPG